MDKRTLSPGFYLIDCLLHAVVIGVVLLGASSFVSCSSHDDPDEPNPTERASTPAILPTGTDVGTLPGDFSVTPAGTASYVIPLWTPQGRNGMTPRLALSYSSDGGDNPAGHGWALLGGFSMIHRCTSNSQRVFRPSAVQFDNAKDRLCLDGRPLVLVAGTNGAAGAEYRTEPDVFAKIVIDTANSLGPTRLTVFTRDGLVHSYAASGSTSDASLTLSGTLDQWSVPDSSRDDAAIVKTSPGAAFGWLRGSTRDRFDNTIFYRYVHPANRGQPGAAQEPLLDTIEYVDINVGTVRTRSIKLNYIDRQLASRRFTFIGGMPFSSTKLLRAVEMRVAKPGSTILATVRAYELTHQASPTTARPLLQSVRECDGPIATATCKRASVFTYSVGAETFDDSGAQVRGLTNPQDTSFQGVQTVDINHDGRDDIVTREHPDAPMEPNPHFMALLSTGEGFSEPVDLGLDPNSETGDAVIADFADANGLPDLAVPGPNNTFLFYRNRGIGVSGGVFERIGAETTGPNKGLSIADFSGRGLVSILRPLAGGTWGFKFVRDIDVPSVPDTSGPIGAAWSLDFAEAGWSAYNVDIDADGARDFLTPAAGRGQPNHLSVLVQKRVPNPSAPPNPADWQTSAATTLLTSRRGDLVKHIFFDFNGDGLPDALRLRQGRTVPDLIINTGRGFAPPKPLTQLADTPLNIRLGPGTNANDLNDPGVRIVDFDGDGRQDILLVDDGVTRDSSANSTVRTRSNLMVLLSRGDQFAARVLSIPVGLPADGPNKPGSPNVHNWRLTQVLDVNGDGLKDVFQVSAVDGIGRVFLRDGVLPDLMTDVKDGMGKKTKVTYRPMSDRTVYTPAPEDSCLSPQQCIPGTSEVMGTRGWLVSSYRVDNGIGDGQNEYRCTYRDGRVDTSGAGVIGFAEWTWNDVVRNTLVRQTFDLAAKAKVKALPPENSDVDVYAEIGLPDLQEVTISNGPVVRTRTTFFTYDLITANSGNSYYTRPSNIATDETDFRGGTKIPLSSVNQKLVYRPALNDFGILSSTETSVKTFASTGVQTSSEVRTSEFDVFPERWLLGLETTRTVRSAGPSGESETRRFDFQPDPFNGALLNMIIEPEDNTNDQFLFVEFIRNPFGQVHLLRRTDHLATVRLDTIDYDAHSVHPAKLTNALGHVTTLDTDAGLGAINSVKDPNNVTTTFDYDAFARLRRVNYPGGGGMSVRYARDIEADSLPEEERFVATVTRTFDGGGENHAVINRLGQQVRGDARNLDGTFSFVATAYNALGLPSSITRPAPSGAPGGPATLFDYDSLGRLVSRIRPEEALDSSGAPETTGIATTSYDRLTAELTDELGRVNHFEQDAIGRLIKSEATNDASQSVPTEYTYGAFGVLRFVVRKNGAAADPRTTEMGYDKVGRRTTLTDPDIGARTTKYNAFGEVREEIDATGAVTTFIRDPLGRIKERTDNDGKTTFTWDTAANGKGQLAQTTSPSGVKRQFFYDTFGRMNREIWTISGQVFQLDYTFDAAGRVLRISYPNVPGFTRFAVRNIYDAESGDLSRVVNDTTGAAYWEMTTTKPDGQIAQEVFGNGIVTNYGYSERTGRVATIASAVPGATPVRSWSYLYSVDGNLRNRLDVKANEHERFEYDQLSRLRSWLAADSSGSALPGGWSVSYTLDDFGNLTRRNFVAGSATGGTSQDVSYSLQPGTNRVTSSPFGGYTYDANGNQKTRPDGEAVTYTAFDMPKAITGPRSATFLYDAFGTRARKERSPTEFTLYVGGVFEKRIAGSAIDDVFYVTAGGRGVAQVTRREGGAETTRFLHEDRLGSIDAVTDSNGAVVERTKHDPFGNRITKFNEPSLPTTIAATANKVRFGFTGHEHDDDLGLINMRGRVYDPRLGKFLTGDPFISLPSSGQSYNRYAYVLNNPLNLIDPSGFQEDEVDEILPGRYVEPEIHRNNIRVLMNVTWIGPPAGTGGASGTADEAKAEGRFIPGSSSNPGVPNGGGDGATTGTGEAPPPPPSPSRPAYFTRREVQPDTTLEAIGRYLPLTGPYLGLRDAIRSGDTFAAVFNATFLAIDLISLPTALVRSAAVVGGKALARSLVYAQATNAARLVLNPAVTRVYRGGSSFRLKPGDIRLREGLVQPTHGPSLSTDPGRVEKFGGAFQIQKHPDELEIIQRGRDPLHHEIVPREPMTPGRFQELLEQIELF